MKQYKAYFFDLYGTLVDIRTDEDAPALWAAAARFYSAHGAAYTPKKLRADYLRLCAEETERMERLHPDALIEIDLPAVFRALYKARGAAPSAELLAQTAWAFRRASTTHLRCYAGAGELLDTLRRAGRSVVLLSNAQACFTRPELELLGLSARFDRVFLSSEFGFRKPDPRFFAAPLNTLGLSPEDCLMIGNDPTCDVAGARNSSLDAVYIRSALSPRGAPAGLPGACASLPRMNLRALLRVLLTP